MVRGRALIKILMVALISSVSMISAIAQTSEHQRIGVERKTEWELGLELGSGVTREAYESIDYFMVDSYASLDMIIIKSWTASITLPVSSQFAHGDEARRLAMAGLGDIDLSAGWTGRVSDTRLSVSVRGSAPTGAWNPYAAAEGVLAPGSGRWTIGAAMSASRILDPVVLGASFAYDVGLPRAERFSTTLRPGDMALSLSITEVLNDKVGYTLKAAQSALLPELRDGACSLDSFSYAASASIELWYSDGDAAARFGVSKSVTSPDAPARLYAALSYTLRSEKEHD